MIKLIASDLDGTLLQNGAQALTPRAIDLISRLCDAGIHFVSARSSDAGTRSRFSRMGMIGSGWSLTSVS